MPCEHVENVDTRRRDIAQNELLPIDPLENRIGQLGTLTEVVRFIEHRGSATNLATWRQDRVNRMKAQFLDLCERHVREGEDRVLRQIELVGQLERDGHTEAACRGRELLAVLTESLELARRHLVMEMRLGQGTESPGPSGHAAGAGASTVRSVSRKGGSG